MSLPRLPRTTQNNLRHSPHIAPGLTRRVICRLSCRGTRLTDRFSIVLQKRLDGAPGNGVMPMLPETDAEYNFDSPDDDIRRHVPERHVNRHSR
jgi:hypothetical protein